VKGVKKSEFTSIKLYILTTRLFPPSISILFPSNINGNVLGSDGFAWDRIGMKTMLNWKENNKYQNKELAANILQTINPGKGRQVTNGQNR
jgi:hypothetical protein